MMTSHLPSLSTRIVRRAVFLLLLASGAIAYAQSPGQVPLLIKTGAGVVPNIMLTLDDSGSMAFRHMPEDKLAVAVPSATTNPVGSQTVRWDLSDNYQVGVNFRGSVPGNLESANYVLRALRSPDTNTMYYNPEIRYQPWFNDDGLTRRPNSPINTAYLNPPLKATTASSVSSITIGTGSKSFTLAETGKAFVVGQTVTISSTTGVATNWMSGNVTAFTAGSGAITVNVTKVFGSGTLSSWHVVQSPTIDLTEMVPTGIFTAGTFQVGYKYTIVTAGTTNFTTIGALNNTVGTSFIATGRGTGTGTAAGGARATGPTPAGSFVVGRRYTITFSGTTSFTSIGSASNAVGTSFMATGAGSGTGTAVGGVVALASSVVSTGKQYIIISTGSTSFTSIGATSNSVGTPFRATGGASGSGTVIGPWDWCYSNAGNTSGTGTSTTGSNNGCQRTVGPFDHDPGTYFRLTKTGSVYNGVTTAANYTPYTVNYVAAGSFVTGRQYTIVTPGSTSFTSIGAGSNLAGTVFTATGPGSGTGHASHVYTKHPNRIDCAGLTTCTRDEERQNFANWYTYYRDRNLLARGAMMEAFGPDTALVTAGSFVVGSKYSIVSAGSTSFTAIGAANNNVGTVFTATGAGAGTGTANTSNYRLGFGRINKGSAAVDTVNTVVIESNTATYGGGGVRDYTSPRRINLFKWLEDLPASGGTPLVEAMQAVGQYYSRTDDRGPWTDDPSVVNTVTDNKTCRRSYHIIMTDGYWNGPGVSVGNADNTAGSLITGTGSSFTYTPSTPFSDGTSNTLADVSMYYWKTDLQLATGNQVPPIGDNVSFWQNMTNYTVGLGVKGSLDPATDLPALVAATKTWPAAGSGQTAANVDDLWHAAVNSRGKYFSAKDPKELSDAVKSVLAGAAGVGTPTAGVATASTILQAGNRKYVPTFSATAWNGDIQAQELNAEGVVTATAWKAIDKMPTQSALGAVTYTSNRNIVTWDPIAATSVPFKWSSLSPTSQLALSELDPTAALYTTKFVDYLWGEHTYEGTGQPFRSRINPSDGSPFILGDFVNANPVLVLSNFDGQYGGLGLGVVGSPTNPDYATFLTNKAARTSVLFAGGNDGMLHGFKDSKSNPATDGEEVFAYVPRTVYPNLYKLTDKTYGAPGLLEHQFFVDGPLREADAYVKAPGAGSATWRNYLLGALGAGGRAVFALDVTDLANLGLDTVRWEISSANDSDLGYVFAPIKVGVLANGRWVAVFGNGFSSTDGKAVLFVVDIEDAADSNPATRANAIKKLSVGSVGGNGLGGVTLIHNASGQISTIYAGDLTGKLWRFDYNVAAASKFEAVGGGGAALFSAADSGGVAQPITTSPAVWNHALGGYIVVFGTGKLFEDADSSSTTTQSIYAVWDKPSDTVLRPITRSNLSERTLTLVAGNAAVSTDTDFYALSGSAVDWAGAERGWYMDLHSVLPGGRVIYPAQVVGYDTALVTTVAPVQGTPAACDSNSGTGVNFLLPVQSGLNPPNHNFDTNGDGQANGSDPYAVAYTTKADGIDAVVRSQGSNGQDGLGDKGGGGGEGDCTGATCSAEGNGCVPSPLCPEPNTCLASVQSATTGMTVCIYTGSPSTPVVPTHVYDRVWRRIINPPIK